MQSDLLFHEVGLFFDHGRYMEEPIRSNAWLGFGSWHHGAVRMHMSVVANYRLHMVREY